MQQVPKTITDRRHKSSKSKLLDNGKSIDFHKNVILLVGNPNVGKTSVFNRLSRIYAVTANYPFTTVELNIDVIRLIGREFELIDSPGIHRLDHPSEEGQITRDIIINHHPEIIIQVVEASNLERSLLLTAQLLELQIPMILVLNMIDETAKQGIRVNSRLLSELLSIPVIETIATEGKGIEGIKKAMRKLSPPKPSFKYVSLIERFYSDSLKMFPGKNQPPRSIITLLALDDPFALRWIEENYGQELAQKMVKHHTDFLDTHEINLPIAILNRQNRWIKAIIERTVTIKNDFTKLGIQKFGELSRHRVYGWFIVIIVVLLTYLLVGKFGAIFLVNKLEQTIFNPIVTYLDSIIGVAFFNRLLIGDYGLLTTGLFNAIGTVLPIITLFFLVLNFLEDVGYLTNLIILTNRLFKKLGLTGKSILPIVLGFGCKTMATLSTKILESKKEKYIAIFLIGLAIPCSSQMSVIIAVLALQPLTAFIIVILVLIVIEILAGLILNRVIPEQKSIDFMMEIPPIRIPDVRLLFQKTYYRSVWFVKEAVPLFLLGALILFILHETSGMLLLEWALRPIVVSFLNLPINFTEAMVMSLARSEAGAVIIMNMVKQGELDAIQVIVSIIVLTLFIPCISNVMAIVKELKIKATLIMVLIITLTAFLIGGGINFILRLGL